MTRTKEEFAHFLKICKEAFTSEFELELAKVAALLTIATRLEELDVDIDRIGRNK